jgi:hypothetical protein
MGKEVFLHRVCGKKFKPIDARGGSSLFAAKGSKVLTIYMQDLAPSHVLSMKVN